MKIPLERLEAHLASGLVPVYLVSGDEPLRVGEAVDAIRAAARALGYTEREAFFGERGADWSALRQSSRSMSLFGERRVLEVRMSSGKPGSNAGLETMRDLVRDAGDDMLVLVITGRLDRSALAQEWVAEVEERGAVVTVRDLPAAELPAWLEHRLRRAGFEPRPEAVQLLAQRVEGNLLAARQEIEKLRLLRPAGPLDAQAVLEAVSDSARFEVGALADALRAGDAARALRVLAGLRSEAAEPTVVLWIATYETRQLWLRRGRRLPFARLSGRAARIDRMIKGRLEGSPWEELALLVTEICGRRGLPDAATIRRAG